MASVAGMRSEGGSEFTAVTVLARHFLAVHIHQGGATFISTYPTQEYRTAKAAAQAFATEHHIPFDEKLKLVDRPIYTVLQTDSGWFPAQIRQDGFFQLTPSGPATYEATKEKAIEAAQFLAAREHSDCLPQIGVSMTEKKA